jgi:hypothetical protein
MVTYSSQIPFLQLIIAISTKIVFPFTYINVHYTRNCDFKAKMLISLGELDLWLRVPLIL